MIRFCQKCGHHYSDTSSTGCQTILLGGGVCGCDCLPLLMTCAPPPQRYTSGPGLASPLPGHEWLNLPPPLEPRLAALEEQASLFRKYQARITYLEEQLGKVPPLLDRIAAMEKTLARLPSLNPSIVKAIRENVDWTKVVSDEEDLLEEDYRGWPEEKKRMIF